MTSDTPSVEEAIRTRRSVRAFADRPIERGVLDRVLELAAQAPSANNMQPWHFVVVEDPARRRDLAALTTGQEWIADAPAIVACCSQRYVDRWSWLGDKMYLVDAAIAVDHLTLVARAEGLGTCWVGAFDARGHTEMKRLLALPDGLDVLVLAPIGYPAEGEEAFAPSRRRKPLGAVVSRETYGGE